MATAIRHIARVDISTIDGFRALGVATVHESQSRTGLMAPDLRPIYLGPCVAGSALTVSVPPGDNWSIHVAVELAQEGDILVVSPTSRSDAGYVGELIAVALQTRGVRAIVIDAGARDTAVLSEMQFPVWSRCISAFGTTKTVLGDVNRPIVCGGQSVRPGDVVVADNDGVVVVPRIEAVATLESARRRAEAEVGARARYANGELYVDAPGQRARLTDAGLEYLDREPEG